MEYEQLDIPEFEIRLLEVIEAPSNPIEPIRFKGTTRKLGHRPEYKAISYCWGDTSKTLPIEVNERIIHVSENLARSLRAAGSAPGALLWADAICINQDDPVEKANQVRLMHLIYSRAGATIVWLGEEGTNMKYAHALLRNINLEEQKEHEPAAIDKFSAALRKTQHSAKALRGLHELLSVPYWERVWIIQEIAKAQVVEV
ncbi:hypothetical protein M426DRAFT_39857, partial [Hypoxylon sp. CI-4A]